MFAGLVKLIQLWSLQQVVDFTVPFWEEPSGVLVRREEDSSQLLLSVFTPLHAWVWIMLLAATLVTALTMVALTHHDERSVVDFLSCGRGFMKWFWYCSTSFLLQG